MIDFSSQDPKAMTRSGNSVLSMHRGLLHRIEAFPFDEGDVALPFATRLARENLWSLAHAERVIKEYRRFVFLGMAAGHPVSPSDAVDQAWHLHLQYTRSYWERFCGGVLGTQFHHEPTRGGPDESGKFVDWYEKTMESYRRIFGPPPQDIWPTPATRFGEDLHYARVNTKRNWIIRRSWFRIAGWTAAAAAFLLTLIEISPICRP